MSQIVLYFIHSTSVLSFYIEVVLTLSIWWQLNTLSPRQNGRLFADNTFKHIFFNENVGISIKISLKFVHKCPINNIPAFDQIMAWWRPGDKPLSEPMVVRLPTHICVIEPQWVNIGSPNGIDGSLWVECSVLDINLNFKHKWQSFKDTWQSVASCWCLRALFARI